MKSITAKIDNTVMLHAEHMSVKPPIPQSVKIDLMRTCNYRCSFCFHSHLEQAVGEMDFSLYKKIIDEIAELGIKEIAPFFFGESFLSTKLSDAIGYAKKKGIEYVFLTTNGSLVTADKVEKCFKAGLNSLKFSLNYSDEEQFGNITNVSPKYFRKVIENIKQAASIRDKGNYDCGLFASYIVYDKNQKQLMEEVLTEVRPFLDEIYSLPLYTQASKIKMDGWEFSGGNQGREGNPVPPIPCWTLFKGAHVNFDGTVCACCFSVDDDFTMGDLKTQSFMEIWHGDKFQKLRQAHLSKNVVDTVCQDCITQKLIINN